MRNNEKRFNLRLTTWALGFIAEVAISSLSADIIATDGSIPAIMDAGGTAVNPAEYILGDAGTFDLSFSDSPAYVGDTNSWNRLSIQSGSTFSITGSSYPNGHFFIGLSSDNVVSVSGAGSGISSKQLFVGFGTGQRNSLSLQNESELSTSSGLSVGSGPSADLNTMEVDNSHVQVAGVLQVGDTGSDNSLSIHSGSLLQSTSFRIGVKAGPFSGGQGNTTVVTGAGTMLEVSGNIVIGDGGSNNSLQIVNGALVRSEGIFSISNLGTETDNYLLLDGGFFAWQGDNLSGLSDLLTDGKIQVWDIESEAWENASSNPLFRYGYFASDAEALAFSGYHGLGGYTILTSVPEPEYYAAIVAMFGIAIAFYRRGKV